MWFIVVSGEGTGYAGVPQHLNLIMLDFISNLCIKWEAKFLCSFVVFTQRNFQKSLSVPTTRRACEHEFCSASFNILNRSQKGRFYIKQMEAVSVGYYLHESSST